MIGLLGWIIGGAIVGWLTSMVVGLAAQQGLLGNIVAGIGGAFTGGLLYGLYTGKAVDFSWNLGSLGIALLGAVIVLVIWNVFARRT